MQEVPRVGPDRSLLLGRRSSSHREGEPGSNRKGRTLSPGSGVRNPERAVAEGGHWTARPEDEATSLLGPLSRHPPRGGRAARDKAEDARAENRGVDEQSPAWRGRRLRRNGTAEGRPRGSRTRERGRSRRRRRSRERSKEGQESKEEEEEGKDEGGLPERGWGPLQKHRPGSRLRSEGSLQKESSQTGAEEGQEHYLRELLEQQSQWVPSWTDRGGRHLWWCYETPVGSKGLPRSSGCSSPQRRGGGVDHPGGGHLGHAQCPAATALYAVLPLSTGGQDATGNGQRGPNPLPKPRLSAEGSAGGQYGPHGPALESVRAADEWGPLHGCPTVRAVDEGRSHLEFHVGDATGSPEGQRRWQNQAGDFTPLRNEKPFLSDRRRESERWQERWKRQIWGKRRRQEKRERERGQEGEVRKDTPVREFTGKQQIETEEDPSSLAQSLGEVGAPLLAGPLDELKRRAMGWDNPPKFHIADAEAERFQHDHFHNSSMNSANLWPAGGSHFAMDKTKDENPLGALSLPDVGDSKMGLAGLKFRELGGHILNALQMYKFDEHSKTLPMVKDALLPLPLELAEGVAPEFRPWITSVILGLNSLYGELSPTSHPPSPAQKRMLQVLVDFVSRCWEWDEVVPQDDFRQFFEVKGVDYRGEEIKLAKPFTWESISPALPKEVGTLRLEDFCLGGCLDYVLDFKRYLLPQEQQVLGKTPRVLVDEQAWPQVCRGLVDAGICEVRPVTHLHHVNHQPLLNGLFSVGKGEYIDTPDGPLEIGRLIMNLVPLNRLCRAIQGDTSTMPTVAGFSSFFLESGEVAMLSSEDIKCFYYLFTVPESWRAFLGFAREVPLDCKPPGWEGTPCHLVARVLPMGFVNSVGLAQHIHRNVIKWSLESMGTTTGAEREIRRDRPGSSAKDLYRTYLDNWDQVRKVDAALVADVEGQPTAHQLALRAEYQRLNLPRHPKKAVASTVKGEVQGAILDGTHGVTYAKPGKILKYLGLAWELLQRGKATQRELQVVAGGMVYITMFRRALLCSLNAIWTHVEALKQSPPVLRVDIPAPVKRELLRFIALIPLAQTDFRAPMVSQVTASDASTTGGGISCSAGLTDYGVTALATHIRGDIPERLDYIQVLTIGLFDGISALRVATDILQLPMIGHISVESNPAAARVTESQFPGSLLYSNVEDITEEVVQEWACRFTNAGVVLVAGGPPCQDVSKLNADRKGATRGARSSLFTHVPRVAVLARKCFPWAQVHHFMESVASMDAEDRATMSQGIAGTPVSVDAAGLSLAHRPRLYWCSWELQPEEGLELGNAQGQDWYKVQPVTLAAQIQPGAYLTPGWQMPPGRKLPTFTTSRPSDRPGRKPAGIKTCSAQDLSRWSEDQHRYPPYQYREENCLRHPHQGFRVANIVERETILGFPVDYTRSCLPKSHQVGAHYEDVRRTLLGNTWSVPVVAVLLKQLFQPLGLCVARSIQQLVDQLAPGTGSGLQTLLLRPPLQRASSRQHPDGNLAKRLVGLVSIKGEDLLLQAGTEPLIKFHRLRSSVPSKLWKWKDVAAWRWHDHSEHINQLEMRAVYTTVKWWISKRQHCNCRLVHLTDSLVVLHSLTRGRSSSRRLRRTIMRINSLLLAANLHPVWAYVHTSMNPADRPSRRIRVKKKWEKG